VIDETKDFDLNDLKDIRDDQERLHFNLRSICNKILIHDQKITFQLHMLKVLQTVLYSLISLGILVFFILTFINIHFIIIIIEIVIVLFYIIYLKYLKYNFRKSLKITKKDLKLCFKIEKRSKGMSIFQIIFYSITILLTISILILSMIVRDPLIFIIIISISLIYIYFDQHFE